jgi:four helix bundle protein
MAQRADRLGRRSSKRHEGLKAWLACHELVLALYRATHGWPVEERYALSLQVRRAAYSAAANIAEGSATRGHRQFRKYLDTALGSLSELSYSLLLARDLDYLPRETWGELEALRDHAGRLTWGLYASVARA